MVLSEQLAQMPSDLERAFQTLWRQLAPDYPEPEHDKRFSDARKWRVDFIWREQKVVVACQGKVWGDRIICPHCGQDTGERSAGGRHVRGAGYTEDLHKYNALADLGYKLFQCTREMLDSDPFAFIELVKRALDDN